MAAGDRVYWTDVDEVIAPPMGRLVQQASQNLADNTSVAITFGAGSEELDTDGFHNTSLNTSRVVPTRAGWYDVRGAVALAGAATYTAIEAFIAKNGAGLAPADRVSPGTGSSTQVRGVQAYVYCNGTTDYFEVYGRQVSGGTRATVFSSQFTSVLEWKYERA